MIEIIAATLIATSSTISDSDDIDKFCSDVVGIPYASDNFSGDEWKRFKYCVDTLVQ